MLRSGVRGRLMFWCFELEIYCLLIKKVLCGTFATKLCWVLHQGQCGPAVTWAEIDWFEVASLIRYTYGDSPAVTWAESDVISIVIWCQSVVLALKEASWVHRTWGLFFSYLSFFYFSLGEVWYFSVECWHWRCELFDRLLCCMLVFYEYNLFFINYWWSWDIIEI